MAAVAPRSDKKSAAARLALHSSFSSYSAHFTSFFLCLLAKYSIKIYLFGLEEEEGQAVEEMGEASRQPHGNEFHGEEDTGIAGLGREKHRATLRPESEGDNDRKVAYDAESGSHESASDVQVGVKKVEGISSSWTKWSLTVAYIS